MGGNNAKEPFDPSCMICQKHYQYITTIDLDPQASKRLYCDACVLETKSLYSTISINSILLPSALQEFSQKIRRTAEELQDPIQNFIKNQLDHQITSSIELLLQAKAKIEKNLLGILDHDISLTLLENLSKDFMKNESIKEGDRLNLYVNLYMGTLKKHERIAALKEILPQQLSELQNYLNCTKQMVSEFCEYLVQYPQEGFRTAPMDDLVLFYRQLLKESEKNEDDMHLELTQLVPKKLSDFEFENTEKTENIEPNVRYEKGMTKMMSAQKGGRERRTSRSKEKRALNNSAKSTGKTSAEGNQPDSAFGLFKAEIWSELLAKYPHSSLNEIEKPR